MSLGFDVQGIGRDTARVPLPGCAITFARGPADRITAVSLTWPGAPTDPWPGCGTWTRAQRLLLHLDEQARHQIDVPHAESPPGAGLARQLRIVSGHP
jgi:hypothetical protein